MRVAGWFALTVVLTALTFVWAPLFALAVVSGLLCLAEHERGPARKAERRARRRGGYIGRGT